MTPEPARVLLVDDQPARLLSYEAILGDLGLELVKVNSGENALHALIQGEFAVILLDVNMPGIDGFETASLIHQHPRHEKTPIIFVTGVHVTDMDRLRGYKLGAFDYVYVPVVPEILRTKVIVLAELFQQRQELKRLNESLRAEKTRELESLNRNLERANTELAQTNRKLREESEERGRAEARMRFLADTIPSIVWTCAPGGALTYVNRNWLDYYGSPDEGRTPEELPGLVVHPEEADSTREHVMRSLDSGERFEFEARHRKHNGEYNWFITRAVPWRDAEGNLVSWFGITTNVNHQRELMERLRESDRRKDEFLAILGHELRNPLAPINNAVQVMRLKGLADPQLASMRDMMERQLKHLTRLVDDLLDVSRITRGKIELRREALALPDVLLRAIEASRPLIDQRNQHLHVHLPLPAAVVEADSTRIEQVFANLLSNASKYSGERTRIELEAQALRDAVVVRIRDQGAGIPADMMERIFEPFTQIESTRRQALGGLGIGLALVRRLVQMHGGHVEAQSEGAGRGSTFSVYLPLSAAGVAPAVAVEPPIPNGVSQRILVADDNRDAAASLALMLRLDGHEVQVACDGHEALVLAEAMRPDVMLLDIGMPGMDGYETARRIRAKDWGNEVMLVALTGWGQLEDRRRALEADFDAHRVKPIAPADLKTLLARRPRPVAEFMEAGLRLA